MVAGGGGRSSMGTSSLGGDGGDLSNSAMGASSGMGDTELLSIADNFMGDTLAILITFSHLRETGGEVHTQVLNARSSEQGAHSTVFRKFKVPYLIKSRGTSTCYCYSPRTIQRTTFPIERQQLSGSAPDELRDLEAIKELFIVVHSCSFDARVGLSDDVFIVRTSLTGKLSVEILLRSCIV